MIASVWSLFFRRFALGVAFLSLVLVLFLASAPRAGAAEETTTTSSAPTTSTTTVGAAPIQTAEVSIHVGMIVALTCGAAIGGLLWRGRIS